MLKGSHVNYSKAKKCVISGTYLKPIYKSIDICPIFFFFFLATLNLRDFSSIIWNDLQL